MNYTFFIQPINNGPQTRGVPDRYRFMLLPDNSRVTIPKEDYKRLMVTNSIQNFLNLELSDDNRPSFKGSYINVGPRIYPLIVVTTQKDGAFRVPFGPGKAGLDDMKRTFREIQLAFKRFENRRLAQLNNNSAPRIGAGAPPKEDVDLFEKEMKGMNGEAGWTPMTTGVKREKSEPHGSSRVKQHSSSSSNADGPASKNQKSAQKRNQARSTRSVMMAIGYGVVIAIGIIATLSATRANADELPVGNESEAWVREEQSSRIDLNIQIKPTVPTVARTRAGCTLGGQTNVSADTAGFRPTGFEGLFNNKAGSKE